MASQECAEIKRSFRKLESKRESGPKVGQFTSQAELLQKGFLQFSFRHCPKLFLLVLQLTASPPLPFSICPESHFLGEALSATMVAAYFQFSSVSHTPSHPSLADSLSQLSTLLSLSTVTPFYLPPFFFSSALSPSLFSSPAVRPPQIFPKPLSYPPFVAAANPFYLYQALNPKNLSHFL